MIIIKIGMELYFEFINYRFVSKIRYIYIADKKIKRTVVATTVPFIWLIK